MTVVRCRLLVGGAAAGPVLRLDEPLSLWGGLDPRSGAIIDRRHPQRGERVTGTVLAMAAGRGSSSASSVLLEAVRAATAPAAILLAEVDGVLALGALVARELYDAGPPVAVVPAARFAELTTGTEVELRPSGDLHLAAPGDVIQRRP